MSSIENKLTAVLVDAEAAVLKVLADAAAVRDYAAIDHARILAGKLRKLYQEMDSGDTTGKTPEVKGPSRIVAKKSGSKSPGSKKKGYPKFLFRDGSLYKLGWSKKKNDEYVHRVPVAVVTLVSSALQALAGSTAPVSSEQILESDPLKGSVPNYQVYIVLAFLKDRGIINPVGREGFQLPPQIKSTVDEIVGVEAN